MAGADALPQLSKHHIDSANFSGASCMYELEFAQLLTCHDDVSHASRRLPCNATPNGAAQCGAQLRAMSANVQTIFQPCTSCSCSQTSTNTPYTGKETVSLSGELLGHSMGRHRGRQCTGSAALDSCNVCTRPGDCNTPSYLAPAATVTYEISSALRTLQPACLASVSYHMRGSCII